MAAQPGNGLDLNSVGKSTALACVSDAAKFACDAGFIPATKFGDNSTPVQRAYSIVNVNNETFCFVHSSARGGTRWFQYFIENLIGRIENNVVKLSSHEKSSLVATLRSILHSEVPLVATVDTDVDDADAFIFSPSSAKISGAADVDYSTSSSFGALVPLTKKQAEQVLANPNALSTGNARFSPVMSLSKKLTGYATEELALTALTTTMDPIIAAAKPEAVPFLKWDIIYSKIYLACY